MQVAGRLMYDSSTLYRMILPLSVCYTNFSEVRKPVAPEPRAGLWIPTGLALHRDLRTMEHRRCARANTSSGSLTATLFPLQARVPTSDWRSECPRAGPGRVSEAKAELTRLISSRWVTVETKAYDHYGRRVAQVWRQLDGLDVNKAMRAHLAQRSSRSVGFRGN